MVYDLLIIGSGPAGLAAGIYAKRAELNSAVLERSSVSGGQILNTSEVDNYPGLGTTSGQELGQTFRDHCDKLGVSFITTEVTGIELTDTPEKGLKLLHTSSGDMLCKAVVIATGAAPRMLGAKGEEELLGCGVSYCATCDGAFFRNRTVAVVGGGDVAVEDALYLSRICKKVYLIHRREGFRAAASLVTKAKAAENIEFLLNCEIPEIIGSDLVDAIVVKNKQDGSEQTLAVEGIFIAVGNKPNSELVSSLVETDGAGFITAGETCETSVPGIFAAGDVRTTPLRQVVTSAADGANAVYSAERYINSL